MKKIFFVLTLLFICSLSVAQTVGDNFDYIKQNKPGGEFNSHTSEISPYSYTVFPDDADARITYMLDSKLICIQIVIAPLSNESRNTWISTFDSKWVRIDSRHWKYYIGDGTILRASLVYLEDIGELIFIGEE